MSNQVTLTYKPKDATGDDLLFYRSITGIYLLADTPTAIDAALFEQAMNDEAFAYRVEHGEITKEAIE